MPFTPTNFQNKPSTATPLTAAELNKLGNQHAQALADVATAAADPETPIGAALSATIAGEVASVGALKADFIRRAGNALLTDGDVVILGRFAQAAAATATNVVMGGASNSENVIGGNFDNVAEPGEDLGAKVSNLTGATPLTGDNNGNWNAILGGYDIVNRGWANIVAGHHIGVADGVNHTAISGGSFHRATGAAAYCTIAGGTTNKVSALAATVGGGMRNTVTHESGVIAGGADNTVGALRGTISGGRNNSVTGESSTIGGGHQNSITSTTSVIAGGRDNAITGLGSAITGGAFNSVSGGYGRAGGRGAVASHGQDAWASTEFTAAGDAQTTRQVVKNTTTAATSVDLLDSAGLTPTCAENTSWFLSAQVIARRTETTVESAAFEVKLAFQRGVGNTGAIVGTATVTPIGASAGASTWTVAVNTHSDGRVRLTVTGEASKTIRWVANVTIAQVKQ